MKKFDASGVLDKVVAFTVPGITLKASTVCEAFDLPKQDIPERYHEAVSYLGKIRYRVRKLNQLLEARGLRVVESYSSGSKLAYLIVALTLDHPYMKSQKTRALNASTHKAIASGGIRTYNGRWDGMKQEEIIFVKNCYSQG
ncbi:MAG: hypothetical protein FNT15_05855 [Sulfurovum sp.]|nr:MAG: hypothetical protein FNT15_05855 [Sulfurovum sp.]